MKDRRYYFELERIKSSENEFLLIVVFQFRNVSNIEHVSPNSYHAELLKRLGFELHTVKEDPFLNYCEIQLSRKQKIGDRMQQDRLSSWPIGVTFE